MMTQFWDSFSAALIGSIIGGGFVLLGVSREHKNNLKLHEFQRRKRIDGVLRAIRYELEILGQIYQQKAGSLVEKLEDGKPYMVYFSLTEKYFIVYPNNTEIVGQIDDSELCKAIVVTYNKANFLLESFRINNWYLDRLSDFQKLRAENVMDNYVTTNINSLQQKLIEWAPQLKQAHNDLGRETENLFAEIDNFRLRNPTEAAVSLRLAKSPHPQIGSPTRPIDDSELGPGVRPQASGRDL